MVDSAGATWAPGSEAEVRVNVEDEWRLETTLRWGRGGEGEGWGKNQQYYTREII